MMHVYSLIDVHLVIPASAAVVIIDDDKILYIFDRNVYRRVVRRHLSRHGA